MSKLPLGPLLAVYRTRFVKPDHSDPAAVVIRSARTDWLTESFLDGRSPEELVAKVRDFYRAVVPLAWHEGVLTRRAGMLRHGLGHLLRGMPLGLAPGSTAAQVFLALYWGLFLHHYWLDQKIWRPSTDARLRTELGLANP